MNVGSDLLKVEDISEGNFTNFTAKPFIQGTNFGSKVIVITISAQVLITIKEHGEVTCRKFAVKM